MTAGKKEREREEEKDNVERECEKLSEEKTSEVAQDLENNTEGGNVNFGVLSGSFG